MKQVMTIAGSDSGAGAGIQADLKAFAAMGVYGTTVITSVTAQNTTGVTDIHDVPVSNIRAQIRALFDDFDIAAVKTGMLASAEIVACAAEELGRAGERPIVVDPVMIAASRAALMREGAFPELIARLLPLATVTTPNLHEASVLADMRVETSEEIREAARRIRDLGSRWVLVKGGHGEGKEAVDVLYDGRTFLEFRAPRLVTRCVHGTGCTFASALAARLALGESVPRAARNAKVFITEAIRRGIEVGRGNGPTNPLYLLPEWTIDA
ncbi:MAG: bifunctional hydroxymethylpyrimidine kinase/phosphomethylpyrimidine kinase [Candidatus Eisenbacteria bacterium]|nr:bifunctional hydroxymethylpyrimidine kinase/phosphomethylpyrimidine kinase [Candidatus Eisenbacteria bacterium]